MDIPKIFYSSETGQPFENCMVCNAYLLTDEISYAVEKVVRQIPSLKIKETLFEYAICSACMFTMYNTMSVESRKKIQEYFQQHNTTSKRRIDLSSKQDNRTQSWIEHCFVHDTLISKSPEYQLTAQFTGKHLNEDHMPMAISFEAMEEMNSFLSDETRQEMDDFMGNYFSGPPEIAALLKSKRPIFI
jgi:hypothetical protein